MAKKDKQSFEFGLNHIFRLIIFGLLFYFLINFFSKDNSPSQQNLNIDKLALQKINITQFIPEDSKQKFENIPQTPLVLGVSHQIDNLKEKLNGFPQNQLNWLKKEIATYIYKSIIKDVND